MLTLSHTSSTLAVAADSGGLTFVAVLLLAGGAVNLLAAILGLTRSGDLRTTIGRQLQSTLGKRGAIGFWLAIAVGCFAAGAWLLVAARG